VVTYGCVGLASYSDLLGVLQNEPKYKIMYEKGEPPANAERVEIMIDPDTLDKFYCVIPTPVIVNNVEKLPSVEELQSDIEKTLEDEAFKSKCTYRMEGWWYYEFCYGSQIRQFHQEGTTANNIKVTQENYLGRAPKESYVNAHSLVYTEVYDGGSHCDITGKPRRTTVNFICNTAEPQTTISKIEESSTCQYVISVTTPHLCKIYPFAPKQVYTSIVCYNTEGKQFPNKYKLE